MSKEKMEKMEYLQARKKAIELAKNDIPTNILTSGESEYIATPVGSSIPEGYEIYEVIEKLYGRNK